MEGFVQKKAPVVAEDYEGMSFETARVIRDAVKEDPELPPMYIIKALIRKIIMVMMKDIISKIL